MTQGSQLLPQHSPAGGLTGLVGDVAAASRAVSRTGAGRAFSNLVRVGECDFSVAVVMEGCGTVIFSFDSLTVSSGPMGTFDDALHNGGQFLFK